MLNKTYIKSYNISLYILYLYMLHNNRFIGFKYEILIFLIKRATRKNSIIKIHLKDKKNYIIEIFSYFIPISIHYRDISVHNSRNDSIIYIFF